MKPHARLRGFTLIEIMVSVAIMAVVMAIGVPSMFRAMRQDTLRSAVAGILEAAHFARAQAILTGEPKDMVVRPREGVITAPGKSEPVQIPSSVVIELMGVNFVEMQDADEARVRFYPNGTCDEFTILLRSDHNEYRKISLEVVTGLADVETDPSHFTGLKH